MKSPGMAEAHRSAQTAATGLRVLLEDIIDYAGTFPPASLPLDEAIKNFARYRSSSESWMLGRFVVPASRLSELDAHAALFEEDPPFRFSVLVGRSDDAATFLSTVESDLERAAAFRRRHGDLVSVDAFEMRMPAAPLTTDVVTVGRFLTDVRNGVNRREFQNAGLFFEIPLDQNCRQTVPVVAGAVDSLKRYRTSDEQGVAGLKMRTGGTEPDAVPQADTVASVIAACRDAGIPFKATAGLHHPVRHYDEAVGAKMYGFFNVFVAAVLATSEHAEEADLVAVLLEEDAGAFSFSDDGVQWKGHQASIEVVARTRRDRAISFGSCSFAEPVEDLRTLGVL